MSSFAAYVAKPQSTKPDPQKHVNYNRGMVLGADDFTQEFAYLSGRDQWMARELIGYGTACGLRVDYDVDANKGPRISVDAGVAVSPRGQLIRVPAPQCAYLDTWLTDPKHRQDVETHITSGLTSPTGDMLKLYVVLCYRDCPTDNVPIPGEPCRTEEESMAASRLIDDFKLELTFDPPDQREEEALRDFVNWLSQIEITDTHANSIDPEEFEVAIRAAIYQSGLPPDAGSLPSAVPDFMVGSPPATLVIHADDMCEYMRVAFRIWTTELRPRWFRERIGCGDDPVDEACVMLAELHVPLIGNANDRHVDQALGVEIHEEHRPFVLHLRMLQEWLLCGRHEALPSDTVVEERAFDQPARAGTSAQFSRADHTHGTPPDPIPPHVDDTTAHNNHAIDGDVTQTIGANRITSLQGNAVNAEDPGDRHILRFDAAQRTWITEELRAAPVEGHFVGRPQLEPDVTYGIVAAGIVSRQNGGFGRRPSYNNLSVIDVQPVDDSQDIQMRVTFDDYKRPAPDNARFQYIVKALPVFLKHDDSDTFLMVNFEEFLDDGFMLRITPAGGEIPDPNRIEVMIEVSQYPFPAANDR